MGRRNGRSGAGGMKQLGAVHGDKDDFRPSGRGRGGGGGGRGSGGRSVADRSGKYMDRQAAGNMAYTRQIPKFLKQFSHLLGEEKQKPSMSASEHGDAVEKAFLASKDRQDEAPTIVNQDEFANDKRYAKQLKSLVGGGNDVEDSSAKDGSGGGSKVKKEAQGVSSAMERLKALGMKIPAKRKIATDERESASSAKMTGSSKSSASAPNRGMGYLLGKIADLEGRIERRMKDGRVKEANEFMHEKNNLQAEVRRLRQQNQASRDHAGGDSDDKPSSKKGRKKKSKTKRHVSPLPSGCCACVRTG